MKPIVLHIATITCLLCSTLALSIGDKDAANNLLLWAVFFRLTFVEDGRKDENNL